MSFTTWQLQLHLHLHSENRREQTATLLQSEQNLLTQSNVQTPRESTTTPPLGHALRNGVRARTHKIHTLQHNYLLNPIR